MKLFDVCVYFHEVKGRESVKSDWGLVSKGGRNKKGKGFETAKTLHPPGQRAAAVLEKEQDRSLG